MIDKTIRKVRRNRLPAGFPSDWVRYELGKGNWSPAEIPDMGNGNRVTRLTPDQLIDVIILGDGYETEAQFEARLKKWLDAFFRVDVYRFFAGAFRIRALYTPSQEPASSEARIRQRKSFYCIRIQPDNAKKISSSGWRKKRKFRRAFWKSVESFDFNDARYPRQLRVTTNREARSRADRIPIHNTLQNMYSNCVICMLVRSKSSGNAIGFTRVVKKAGRRRRLNVAFGSGAIHEFGHAFAYLEDEYINGRGSSARDRRNARRPSVFTLSNLSFDDRVGEVPWSHLSPWGRVERQAAGDDPSPVVGWLWRGGEEDEDVWHMEYRCLMNGKHDNYAFTHDSSQDPTAQADGSYKNETGAWLRNSKQYCLWCEEVVVVRILEKTGQLAASGDPDDINARGRVWYRRWLKRGQDWYWDLFGIAAKVAKREAQYADPNKRIDLLKNNNLDLWKSDLYRPFRAKRRRTRPAPPEEQDGELMLRLFG